MPTEDGMIALSDLDLLRGTYELVRDVADDSLSDAFHWHLREAFERFAPDVERQWQEEEIREEHDPEQAELELEASLRFMREREGARLLAREFGEREEA